MSRDVQELAARLAEVMEDADQNLDSGDLIAFSVIAGNTIHEWRETWAGVEPLPEHTYTTAARKSRGPRLRLKTKP